MIRAPGICEFSLGIFVCCLLQMEEQRPARMPVHSDMLGHAICMCLTLYCSQFGHSLFRLRDLVVTLHRSRAHTSEVCCEATSCASRSHLFRTCLRQAQRAACPCGGVNRGGAHCCRMGRPFAPPCPLLSRFPVMQNFKIELRPIKIR